MEESKDGGGSVNLSNDLNVEAERVSQEVFSHELKEMMQELLTSKSRWAGGQ